jgi:hypothetical protein
MNFYNGSMIFGVNNAEQMRLTSTGLGIGTSTGSSYSSLGNRLVVGDGSGNEGITIATGTADNGSLLFADGTSGSAAFSGYIQYDHSVNAMKFGTAGALGATLNASGGLGIGETSIASDTRLHLKHTTDNCLLKIQSSFGSILRLTNGGGSEVSTIDATGNNVLTFQTGSTERARINTSGSMGIGTTSPSFASGGGLAIYNASAARLALKCNATGANNGLQLGIDTSGVSFIEQRENAALTIATNSTERARISAAGGFSVGTTADAGAGGIFATGNITAYYSDARLKTVSGKIENALDKVSKLSGVYYTNNDVAKSFGYTSEETQVGVLAQEIEAVMPEVVKAAPFDLDEHNNSKSGENYKTVQYDRLVPLLIEAINELRAEVKALKGE